MTEGSWVRDTGLYYSLHSRQEHLPTACGLPSPRSLGVTLGGPGRCSTQSGSPSQLGNTEHFDCKQPGLQEDAWPNPSRLPAAEATPGSGPCESPQDRVMSVPRREVQDSGPTPVLPLPQNGSAQRELVLHGPSRDQAQFPRHYVGR